MNERITRRTHLKQTAAVALAAWSGASTMHGAETTFPTRRETFGLLRQGKKIPEIFDTDIGDDIDDTWALLMLLNSPELDVRMVAADGGNTLYRARLMAKLLEAFGRPDIPIAVGLDPTDKRGRQSDWVKDYDLSRYPGKVHRQGIDAVIRTIHDSADPITLVCTGPVPTIGELVKRDESVCRKSRFVGMHGSVRRGYGGRSEPAAEWNVRAAPEGLQAVFAAPWDISITPLDTCGIVTLRGEKYARVYQSESRGAVALLENYRVWKAARSGGNDDISKASSTLFDTVAVYMAYSEELLKMETLPIRVTDDGMTKIDQSSRRVHCAMEWQDLGAFEDLLVSRIIA